MESDDHTDTTDRDPVTFFWSQYVEEAEKYDAAFREKDAIRMDGVLVFAGLFSGVTASFLSSIRSTLQPNPSDTTNALLMMVVHSLDNSTFSGQTLEIPTWNGPTNSTLWAQALGYGALSASLLASFGAIVGKRWVYNYTDSKIGSLQERGSRRQQKLDAFEAWRFEYFLEALPGLLQLALLLFGLALSTSLWETNKTVGWVVIAMTGLGVLFHFFVTAASFHYPTCPFHTPLSSPVHFLIRTVTAIVTESVEELADYFAWRSINSIPQWQPKPVTCRANGTLMRLAVLPSLLIVVCIMPIVILFSPICLLVIVIRIRNGQDFRTQISLLNQSVHSSASTVRNWARQDLDPTPDLTPHAVAWLLRTSTHPSKFIAALGLVPAVPWPNDYNVFLGEGPRHLFARSIPKIDSSSLKECLPLGRALVVLLCQIPLSVHDYQDIWRKNVEQLDRITREHIEDCEFDVVFTLTIVGKLLRIKLGSEDHGPELPQTRDVSQPLLVWLLGSLQAMLMLDPSHATRFFPEASQLYLKLDWERANLSPEQQVQYCTTLEVFFDFALGFNVTEVDASADTPAIKKQSDCLKRILAKLKLVKPHRFSGVQEHLIVTLTALSKLATTQDLREVIKDAAIDSWILAAFKEAVGRADEDENMWDFVGCLVQLAADVDAFNPTRKTGFLARAFSRGKPPPSPPRMDSKSLLSYLLNVPTLPTSKQVVYVLRTMLSNEDEHLVLASDPHFIDNIMDATEPSEAESIREVGLKVLIATCLSLLRAHDADKPPNLADSSHVRFVHRAILNQDKPTILSDLLRINNKDFNEKLFEDVPGDSLQAALTKLRDEPNKIPEHDLRNLEIALVLWDGEGKKKYPFNLDNDIAAIPLSDSRSTLTLPLTATVGWLLRQDGLICSSGKSVWNAFLRSSFENLLFPAWGDPDALRDNPETLRLLLNCTEKWLSTYSYYAKEVSSQSPSDTTLARVQHTVDRLISEGGTLHPDIKNILQEFSSKITRCEMVIDSTSTVVHG